MQRSPAQTVTASEPSTVPASLLTNGVDRNGRCIAFLYAGDGAGVGTDGERVFVTAQTVLTSLNASLLSAGLAYPTFYSELFVDLREALAELSEQARTASRGLWAQDRTLSGVTVEGLSTLTAEAVILPKLFRRLTEYLGLGDPDSPDLSGFSAFLDTHGDRVLVLPRGQVTGLSTVVQVEGRTVRLTEQPQNLVFFEA